MNITELKASCHEILTENILPFWLDKMQDQEQGGWYGQMTGRGELVKNAPKGAILYARLLWTFSAAYRVLGMKSERVKGEKYGVRMLEDATMTKDYILEHFMDKEYGGVYWSLTADGKPLDTRKQFYAMAFMIYGFSEYARATGDEQALATAVQLFETIEQYARDQQKGGYIEACMRDWQVIGDMRLSEHDENYPKSQNTHLHILEAYTNLLRALSLVSERVENDGVNSEKYDLVIATVKASLRNLITVFTDRILNPATHHLDLFFNMDWQRMSTTESYGHDIECSWLMHEAAMVLGDVDIYNKVEPVVRQVAKASMKGLRSDGSMVHESGDEERQWWVQAEAVVGFVNLYQHFGDEAALQKAFSVWQYITSHLIDYENGEWYWSIRADGTVNLDNDHAGFWKCPYHNSRMCLEVLERKL